MGKYHKGIRIEGAEEFLLAVNITGHGAPTEDTEAEPGMCYLDEDSENGDLYKCIGMLVTETGTVYRWKKLAGQEEVERLSEAIEQHDADIEKLIDANSEVVIQGNKYDWVAGYFDANGHFNGAYYYRIAIKKWFAVESGATYRFRSNSTDKLLIRGYSGTTGYDFVATLVALESDAAVTMPDNVTYITVTQSRMEDSGDSVEIVNQMLADAANGLINPTVTKLFASADADLSGYVRSVNGTVPDENGNVTIEFPGSGGSDETWEEIINTTLDEAVGGVTYSVDKDGNPFSLKEFTVFVINKPITGQTTNNRIALALNGATWGHAAAYEISASAKETEKTVYSYAHIGVMDGKLRPTTINVSANYSSVNTSLVALKNPTDYNSPMALKVNGTTNEIQGTNAPCTKIGFVGLTSLLFGAGSQIIIRGVRA